MTSQMQEQLKLPN
jgi:hypothetical protein